MAQRATYLIASLIGALTGGVPYGKARPLVIPHYRQSHTNFPEKLSGWIKDTTKWSSQNGVPSAAAPNAVNAFMTWAMKTRSPASNAARNGTPEPVLKTKQPIPFDEQDDKKKKDGEKDSAILPMTIWISMSMRTMIRPTTKLTLAETTILASIPAIASDGKDDDN